MKATQRTSIRARILRVGFGVSASAVAVLACLPQTGWLVRKQLGGTISGADTAAATQRHLQTATELGLAPRLHRAALAHPDDLPMQIAATAQQAREAKDVPQSLQAVRDLWELQGRFGDDPVFCANYLRFACWAAPGIGRDWEKDYLSEGRAEADANQAKLNDSKTPRLTRWRDEPEYAARALEMAKRGAARDKDNAFFPYMEATIYLAQNRDADAYDALHRAAACTRYRDYIAAEGYGRVALLEAAEGTQGTVSRTTVMSVILFPHFSTLRSAAQVATARAALLEEAGDKAGAFQIRHDLARVGAVMRHDGATGISNLVGTAITRTAGSKPDGAELPRHLGYDDRVISQKSDALYRDYLIRTGHADEAAWYGQERQRGEIVRNYMERASNLSIWGMKPIIALIFWWGSGIVLLLNALWMLVGGAIAARLAPKTGAAVSREAVPLALPVRLGFGAAGTAAGVALLGYLPLATNVADAVVSGITLSFMALTVLAAPLAWLRRKPTGRSQELSRDTRRKAWRRSRAEYGWTAGLSAVVLTSAAIATLRLLGQWRDASAIFNFFASSDNGNAAAGMSNLPLHALVFVGVALSVIVVPLLVALISMVRGRKRGIPASSALVSDFRRLALPVTTILLTAYIGVALATVAKEYYLWQEMDRAIAHEGRYGASLLNQPWPGLASEVQKAPAS